MRPQMLWWCSVRFDTDAGDVCIPMKTDKDSLKPELSAYIQASKPENPQAYEL